MPFRSASDLDDIAALRQRIDSIDDEMLRLVGERTALAGAIAAAKAASAGEGLTFRAAREVQILRRLTARAPDLPAKLIGSIWRALIGANLLAQGRFRLVATPGLEDVARLRFGVVTEPQTLAPDAALAAALDGALAVLPWPGAPGAGWWRRLAEPQMQALFVVGAAPLLAASAPDGTPRALLVAALAPEAAGEDVTLIHAVGSVAVDVLAKRGIDGRAIARDGDAMLIAAPGFVAPGDVRLVETAAGLDGARVAGAFAFA